MKNWKKMIVTAAALASMALFAGCTTASAVSVEEAKQIVQQTVGEPNAVVVELDSDRDDGVYELEVLVDGVSYEYEVDSRTGQIREVERDGRAPAAQVSETKPAETAPVETQPADTTPAETQPARITLEEAKAIAYAHAGVKESDAYDKSYERDDGMYEIDFEYDGYDYEYDISYEGKILKSRKDRDDDRRTAATPAETKPVETQPAVTQPTRITLEEAKAIAYAHAGVKESDAYDKSYERDDGMYEIDFEYDGYDYEYDISYEGKILKSRKDRDDDRHDDQQVSATQPATQPARITAEEALTIAMNHAGVTDIRDRDVEWDDGRWEVSFESGRTEYEYKIAADGTTLRWEKDNND